MDPKKKFHRPPSNTVYQVDGVSFGLDDRLVAALQQAVLGKLREGTLVIPRPPQVAMRVLQLSESVDATIDDITRVVMTDPSLAARMLSIANSAAYAGNAPATNLGMALSRIGMKAVNDLVFTESLRSGTFAAKTHRLALEKAWRLSVGVAVACDVLARAIGVDPESAFLMGLLHEIGVPTLIHTVAEYARENQGRVLEGDTVDIVVNQLHEEIGAHVLRQWGMPETMIAAAGSHHRYVSASKSQAVQLCFAANRVCQHLGIGEEGGEVNFTTEHVFLQLGLNDKERMTDLLESVSSGVESLIAGLGGGAGSGGPERHAA